VTYWFLVASVTAQKNPNRRGYFMFLICCLTRCELNHLENIPTQRLDLE
ncbi:4998_t:CDS:1, partial [Dentiscutata heterogama]